MTEPAARFRFDGPVALIGGGVVEEAALREARARAAFLVAADGAANRFWGETGALSAVIGDLDSLDDAAAWRDALGERLLGLAEQDTTDFEKCLYSVEAPCYFAVGFLGGRFDHSLSATHVLLKRSDRRVVLITEGEILFLVPRRWRIGLPCAMRLSLYPLAPARALRSEGLRWPLDGLDLEVGERVGISNETSGETVEIDFAGSGEWSTVLAILERAHLDAALASLGLPGGQSAVAVSAGAQEGASR